MTGVERVPRPFVCARCGKPGVYLAGGPIAKRCEPCRRAHRENRYRAYREWREAFARRRAMEIVARRALYMTTTTMEGD